MGARDMEFQGLRSHATPYLEMQNSFRKRTTTAAAAAADFVAAAEGRQLRGCISSNFLVREFFVEVFHSIFSSKRGFYLDAFHPTFSPRDTFILDVFHPNLLSKRDSFVEAFHPIFSSKERFFVDAFHPIFFSMETNSGVPCIHFSPQKETFCGCISSRFFLPRDRLHECIFIQSSLPRETIL